MECLLGVDIGTSRVKVVLVDRVEQRILQESSGSLGELESSVVAGRNERSVSQVLSVLDRCVQQMEASMLSNVRAIGVCGQMHGCVLWNSDGHHPPSNLITWQDGRCDREFLSSLPLTKQSVSISSGYGCATLAWLQRHKTEELACYNLAGTIMDYVVWRMTGSNGPVIMSSQNAVSWGYFNQHSMSWELDILTDSNFPVYLLPGVVTAPTRAGTLKSSWNGVSSGVSVGVAMGDLQCSILATEPTLTDVVLNIGTAGQLAVVVTTPLPHLPHSVLPLPYFNNQSLLVAASLTGGNVVSTLVKALGSWMTELGMTPPREEDVYSQLILRAEENEKTMLKVDVRLWGERHAPHLTGGIANIRSDNISLGEIGSAVFRGIVENLHSMVTADLLQQLGVERLVGSGFALLRNRVLQRHAEVVLGLPLVIKEGVDAPLGAAMAISTLN